VSVLMLSFPMFQYAECHYAECHHAECHCGYAGCHIFIVVASVVIASVVMLSVIILIVVVLFVTRKLEPRIFSFVFDHLNKVVVSCQVSKLYLDLRKVQWPDLTKLFMYLQL